MKASYVLIIGVILLATIFVAGCIGETSKPYSGTFTITTTERNDGTYWIWPSTYHYTLTVSEDNGESATVYATQYFVNRHQLDKPFVGETQMIEDYNNHHILIFSSDTPNEARNDHPDVLTSEGCPADGAGNLLRIVYVENYNAIPGTGAHYWRYDSPDGTTKTNLTTSQIDSYIRLIVAQTNMDCIYLDSETYDYWKNDDVRRTFDAHKLASIIEKIKTLPVNFPIGDEITYTGSGYKETSIKRTDQSTNYGCPGCPTSFMDFAQDMCERMGASYTVEDGINKISCSEILKQGNSSNNTNLRV